LVACLSHWDKHNLSHWDRHSACPTGTGCAGPSRTGLVQIPCFKSWHLTKFRVIPYQRGPSCTKPVPLGQGKVKRDLSLSHGQVIYPHWRPVPVAGQALYPQRNLSQSNLSPPVPQSGTTRPWRPISSLIFSGTGCRSYLHLDHGSMSYF